MEPQVLERLDKQRLQGIVTEEQIAAQSEFMGQMLQGIKDGTTLAIWDIDGVICDLCSKSEDRTLTPEILLFLQEYGQEIYFNTNGIIGDEENKQGFINMVIRSLEEHKESNPAFADADWRDFMPNIMSGCTKFYDAAKSRENYADIAVEPMGLTQQEVSKLTALAEKGLSDFLIEKLAGKIDHLSDDKKEAAVESAALRDWSIPSLMLGDLKGTLSNKGFHALQQDAEQFMQQWLADNDLTDIFKLHHVPEGKGDVLLPGETIDFQLTPKTGKGAGLTLLYDKICQKKGWGSPIADSEYPDHTPSYILRMTDAELLAYAPIIFENIPSTEGNNTEAVWCFYDTAKFELGRDAAGNGIMVPAGSDSKMVLFMQAIFRRREEDQEVVTYFTQNDSMNGKGQRDKNNELIPTDETGYKRDTLCTVDALGQLSLSPIDLRLPNYGDAVAKLAPNVVFANVATAQECLV